MAITKVTRTLLSTGIVDNSNATAITIDSSENVGIGTGSPARALEVHSSSSPVLESVASSTNNSSLRLRGSTSSGHYWDVQHVHGDNDLTFGWSGSEKVRITDTGNVGIGNSSPTRNLTVGDTAASSTINIKSSAANGYSILALGDSVDDNYAQIFLDNATNKLQIQNGGGGVLGNRGITLDSSENVGIGTSSPAARLSLGADIPTNGQTLHLYQSSNIRYGFGIVAGTLRSYAASDGVLSFGHVSNSDGSTYSEKMRIDTSGNVLIAGTSFSAIDSATQKGIALRTIAGRQINCLDSGGNAFEFNTVGNGNAGEITCTGTSTNYSTSSDYRLKNVKGNIENALERTLKLNPVVFEWKADKRISEGFIAHEAQEIFGDAVNGEKDGEKMQSMDYGRITPLLVKAIQEQQIQIEALQSEINLLKGE